MKKPPIEFPEVMAGIAWLDQRYPDWAKNIKLKTLDLFSPEDCIICQVATVRNYYIACKDLGVEMSPDSEGVQEDVSLGFNCLLADEWAGWFKNAEAQWRRAIADRLDR